MKLSRKVIMGIFAGVIAVIGPALGLSPQMVAKIVEMFAILIGFLGITDAVAARYLINMSDKWKDTRIWVALGTLIGIVAFNLFGFPANVVTNLFYTAISLIFGITITETFNIVGIHKKGR